MLYIQSMAGIGYEYRAAEKSLSHSYLFPTVASFLDGLPPGASVVDLGCGNGSFLAQFQARNWRLAGTDFSSTGIDIARSSYPEIDFFLADASAPIGALQEQEGLVDAVISTEVIEHLYDPRGFLRNAHTLLRPGGILVISTPYHGYWKNLSLAITGKLDQHFTVLWDHGHIKFWSRKTLTQALEETGFSQIRFAGSGRMPYLWKSMVLSARKSE